MAGALQFRVGDDEAKAQRTMDGNANSCWVTFGKKGPLTRGFFQSIAGPVARTCVYRRNAARIRWATFGKKGPKMRGFFQTIAGQRRADIFYRVGCRVLELSAGAFQAVERRLFLSRIDRRRR